MTAMPELDELVGLHRDGKGSDETLMTMEDRGLPITEAIKASMQLIDSGALMRLGAEKVAPNVL